MRRLERLESRFESIDEKVERLIEVERIKTVVNQAVMSSDSSKGILKLFMDTFKMLFIVLVMVALGSKAPEFLGNIKFFK